MEIKYDRKFYHDFRNFIVFLMDILYNIRAEGLDNIPTDTNYILAGNHLHILDAALVAKYVDTDLRYMVDKKLYKYYLREYFFKKLGTFEIDPDKMDIKAVKEALILAKEYSLVIFPEGRTHELENDIPFRPGVAGISRLSNLPVVPFGINGTYKPFSDLRISFGEPINFKKLDIPKKEMDLYLEDTVRKLERK